MNEWIKNIYEIYFHNILISKLYTFSNYCKYIYMIYVNIILASFSWFKVARSNIIELNSILLSIAMCNLVGDYHVSDVPTPSIWSSPCAHHKSMWGSGGNTFTFSKPGTSQGEWPASSPQPLYHWGNSPQYHRIGGFVGPRPILDAFEKRKIPFLCPADRGGVWGWQVGRPPQAPLLRGPRTSGLWVCQAIFSGKLEMLIHALFKVLLQGQIP